MTTNQRLGFIKKQLKHLLFAGITGFMTLQNSQAIEVKTLPLANTRAVVVTVDIKKDNLQLFLKDNRGNPYQSFAAINQQLLKQQSAQQQPASQQLIFAMNAGMFHPNYLPVGLYVEQGRELYPLNTATGTGNFFMQPNGIFLLKTADKYSSGTDSVQVVSTTDFQSNPPRHIWLATQSGPLLVYKGKINSQFNPASSSRFIRNAVGVKQSTKAVFVISEQPVSFYELADFFKNTLKIDNALYLDGTISSLYLPALNRHDRQRFLGPIIGVTQSVKRHSSTQ